MSAPATIAFKTECLLCHKVQTNPPMDIPLIGQPGKHVEEFLRRLLMHIGTSHPTEMKQGAALLAQYQTFLMLSQFQSEDPSVTQVLEGIRADVFQRARKNVPTEADLDLLASKVEFSTPADAKKARDAMQAIRDLCCELGAAAPQLPEQSNIVTPAR
jgi:hypothetical protein